MRLTFLGRALSQSPVIATMVLIAWLLPGIAVAQERMSLDLEKTIQMAMEHNQKTKMREDEVEAAGYHRKQAAGRFLPRLSLTSRYSRVSHVEPGSLALPTATIPLQPLPADGTTSNTMQFGEAVDNQYSLRLSVDQPLFTGFALLNGYQVTKHAEIIASERLRAERADVRVVAQEAYFNLLTARQMQEVLEHAVHALEEHLQQMRFLYDAGRATMLDVSRVQSRVAAARVSLVQIQSTSDVSHLVLTTILGIPSTTALDLADIVEGKAPESLPGAEQLITAAFSSRPEIAIARETAAVAAASADIEGSSLWPQLSLRYGYNYERPNQRYFPVHDRFDGSWDISVVLSWTPWDWGVSFYGMKAARAEASAAARNVDETRDAVRLDVERQRQLYGNTAEKITAARQALSSAEQAYNAANILFDAGRVLSLDVLDALTELTRARSDLVQAMADARIAWAQVQKAVGND